MRHHECCVQLQEFSDLLNSHPNSKCIRCSKTVFALLKSDGDLPMVPTVGRQVSFRQQTSILEDEVSSRYLSGKGTVHFWKNFAYESENRPFVRVSHDINISEMTSMLLQDWKLPSPRIALVVVSNVAPLSEWSVSRQLENLKKGIIKAANTTDMWIFTNGTNIGVTKEIGDAVCTELMRRQALRCHKHPNKNRTHFPPLTLIGIVREDILTCADLFDGRHTTIQIENEGNRPEEGKYELNPDHSHYIIVRDETVNKTGVSYFTLRLEYHMAMLCDTAQDEGGSLPKLPSSTNLQSTCSMELPLIALVVQGGNNCAKMILEHLKKQMPVVVLEGSGGLADLMGYAYSEVRRRGVNVWNAEFVEQFLKPELSSRISLQYPKYRENVLARNMFRDKILECVRLACQTQQELYFTVINIHDHSCNLEDIDEILLKAVFKSQRPDQKLWTQQMKKDLLLTLDWNSPHVAMSEVFMKDPSCKFQVDRDIFEQALLRPKREEFVHLFLNRGFQVHKYLTPKRLKQLFQKIQHEEFFRSVCWEGALGHGLFSKIGRNFVENDLNWLIETLTGLRDFVDTQELSMNAALGIYTQDPSTAERKSIVVLALWAALTNRKLLCRLLWQNSDQPIHLGLLLSMTYDRLTYYVNEGNTKQELQDTSREFAEMATGVLDYSYREATCRAYDILSEENPDWSYKTAVDIAAEAKNRTFLSHPCCQKWLTNLFMGKISVRDVKWGVFTFPLSVKVVFCAFFIFPMYIWVRFKTDPHEMEYKDEGDDDDEKDERDGEDEVLLNSGDGRLPEVKFKDGGQPNLRSFHPDAMTTLLREREVFLHSPPPLWNMIYLMWSAPITKFWTFQLFYIVFLGIFSVAVLSPSCGNFYLDVTVCAWTALIALESTRRTYILFRKYTSVPMFLRCVELLLMYFFVALYVCGRLLQTGFFIHPYNGKVLLCMGLLYFYYRQIAIYLPISPTLGPLLYRVKLMVMYDFTNFMRMALLVIISGGITAHALLYPDYPFNLELIRRTFHRAWFSLFLTPVSDLEGEARCEKLKYFNHSDAVCRVSKYTDFNCPNPGVWPYLFIIQYLVLLKLVLLTLLYALFSYTAAKLEPESDAIWRFQRYQLVVDFINRLCLPPPLNIISYILIFFKYVWRLISCRMCRKRDGVDTAGLTSTDLNKAQKLSEKDYNYWRQLAFQYSLNQKEKDDESKANKKQMENITTILDDVDSQRYVLNHLKGQVQELQRMISQSHAFLEALKQTTGKAEIGMSTPLSVHVLSRHSPYPATRVQRYPVPDKYVPWEVMWLDYEPVAYARPKADFPLSLQEHVDEDILFLKAKQIPSASQQLPMFKWNCVSSSPAGVSFDRTSWTIDEDGSPVIYKLDSEGVPRNPVGRTGLRGRGALPRWGPNHYVLLVISRWQRSKIHLVGGKGLEIVLMRIFRTDQFSLPGDFIPGEQRYEMFKLLFKAQEGQSLACATKEDVVLLFQNCCIPEGDAGGSGDAPPPPPEVKCEIVQRGYMDDPMNTDHCWREVELWHVHFSGKENLQEKFQANLLWRLVTEDLFTKLPSGQAALLQEVTGSLQAAVV